MICEMLSSRGQYDGIWLLIYKFTFWFQISKHSIFEEGFLWNTSLYFFKNGYSIKNILKLNNYERQLTSQGVWDLMA